MHAHARLLTVTCVQEWAGGKSVGDAMLEMLRRLPRAQWLVTTLGEQGSILLQRPSHGAMVPNASVAQLDNVLGSLFSQVCRASLQLLLPAGHAAPAFV